MNNLFKRNLISSLYFTIFFYHTQNLVSILWSGSVFHRENPCILTLSNQSTFNVCTDWLETLINLSYIYIRISVLSIQNFANLSSFQFKICNLYIFFSFCLYERTNAHYLDWFFAVNFRINEIGPKQDLSAAQEFICKRYLETNPDPDRMCYSHFTTATGYDMVSF